MIVPVLEADHAAIAVRRRASAHEARRLVPGRKSRMIVRIIEIRGRRVLIETADRRARLRYLAGADVAEQLHAGPALIELVVCDDEIIAIDA